MIGGEGREGAPHCGRHGFQVGPCNCFGTKTLRSPLVGQKGLAGAGVCQHARARLP